MTLDHSKSSQQLASSDILQSVMPVGNNYIAMQRLGRLQGDFPWLNLMQNP